MTIPARCPLPPTPKCERAQSSVELIGVVPLLLLAAALCLQATLLGCTALFAQVAVGRAAAGMQAREAASVLPNAWRDRIELRHAAKQVSVRLGSPTIIPGAQDLLVVEASSEVVAP